ncbi:penicillin-binding protein 2 [Neoehrlichia mikurensis]|uniref:Penicillin-binding protein 2 n=1 Tax=Neoehrlichia mikurensis TaxID=89586 RepID=A0A9Q9BUA0_9RICK|nr:penicillin-binding protein 2 [Neoehrlichia mikurensis]QXK92094.1 penicillin-binding protein 2 [Neoehrlichia mikurensis]QXK92551.1 penicillin-binding protein 2 [Neoehrlichia mikurensis]QXK93787.1 penicillin-binding protein 2 [Neoehrlichia mikurensis]UTO55238.1 penicillin-binding protein 2 [Neoehrlichia mikurensis]UTO56158.1 penicillin-binding protein 2 [Neoehrlichia mikurensis]
MVKRDIFDDYNLNKKVLNKSKIRLIYSTGPFIVFYIIIIIRMLSLTLIYEESADNKMKNVHVYSRPIVLDRNGNILATNLVTASVFANANQIFDPESTAQKIVKILKNTTYSRVYKLLTSKKNFVWIERNITTTEELEIKSLGIPGINLIYEKKRIYPQGNLFAHVLGYVDTDNKGISGIEHYIDHSNLSDREVKLSVDMRVQNIVREEVLCQMEKYQALGGLGIVMDVRNGEIISMVSLPDFDLNNQSQAINNQKFNRVSVGVYEIGSIFKLFTIASAIDSKKIKISDTYDVSKPFRIGKYKIQDLYQSKKPVLTVGEIFAKSSNIGMAQIVTQLGKDVQIEYLEKLDLFSNLNIEIPEKSMPILPKKWYDSTMITVSYGYGVAVTPLHVIQASAGLVNNGVMNQATLLFNNINNKKKRIISQETSRELRTLLRFAVKSGTGMKADVHGYLVGGKTGSAEKIIDGKYRRDVNISSFIAAFPITYPKYMIMVLIDEPRGTKVTGGKIAAPIVSGIINRIAPILDIAPNMY